MNIKRTIATLLAVAMILCTAPFSAFGADWGQGDTLEDALAEFKVGFAANELDWLVLPGLGVVNQRYTYYLFKNTRTNTIDEQPVYCIDPTKFGAHGIVTAIGPNPDDGSNTATYIRGEKVGDPIYKSILESGYPHMKLDSLGLISKEEGYYATKVALWMYVRGSNPASLTINPSYGNSDPVALRVREAAISIYDTGVNKSYAYEPNLTLTGKPNGMATLDASGQYYVQEIEVFASGWIGTNPDASGDIQLAWAFPPPAGTIVLGSDGEDITNSLSVKMSVRSGRSGRFGTVTVKYPASGIDPSAFVPPTLNASAIVPNDDIFIAYAKAGQTTYQRYLVERDPKISLNASFISQFSDIPYSEDFPGDTGLRIIKLQEGTNTPLEGAVFEVRNPSGNLIFSLSTDANGIIDIPLSIMGNYTVTETIPPKYHLLPEARTQSVTVKYGEIAVVTFTDTPYGSLRVIKRDAANGRPLGGATIQIKNIVTNTTRQGHTDSSGSVYFDKLPIGAYAIEEITSPDGYALDTTVHIVNVVSATTGETSYTLMNKANPGLRIIKYDEQTMKRIEGVTFEVWRDGELHGVYVTDAWGEIELRNLPAGTYLAREVATIEPYVLDSTAQWIELKDGQGYISELVFLNLKKPGIWLVKVDSQTMKPLPGAHFLISKVGGTFADEFKTDENGEINLTMLEPGAYTVTEVLAPAGYLVDDGTRTIQINGGENAQFVFTNTKKPNLIILKVDEVTAEPLPNAEFSVKRKDGSIIWEGLTNERGEIVIADLDPDWYTITEILPPNGYIAMTQPKDIKFEPGSTVQAKFDNIRKPVLVFLKTNALTGLPIQGATFKVEYEAPNGGLVNLGSFKTGSDGRIVIPKVNPGWYVFTETMPAQGYALPPNPVTRLYISAGQNAYTAEFDGFYRTGSGQQGTQPESASPVTEHSGDEYYVQGEGFNWPLNSIVIKKEDAITGELLAGAVFELYRADGQVSGIPGTQIGRYTTGHSGIIVITGLEPGYYIVKEAQAPTNYLISENSQQNGFLKTDGTTILELAFSNYPKGGLLITKTDANTGKPLAGAKFKVTDSTGAVVGTANGEFVTDADGKIFIPTLRPGTYIASETEAPKGYALSSAPQTIAVNADGKIYETRFTNEPLAGFRIKKIDSFSKQGIYGTEFMIFDNSGKVVGNYVTDGSGMIEFYGTLPEGRYTIRETRPASGYYNDDVPRTVEVKAGKFIDILWENTPKLAQIQVIKKSGDDNEISALPAGTPLEGAIFEAYEYKSGNLVDRFVSGADGRAVSRPLPLGRYIVKEAQAPKWYKLSTQTLDIELEFATQIVKAEFLNYAANTGVYIKKAGPYECMPGDTIRYDIKAVQNTSTVPLTDFYWRDTLPADAVRLAKIVTGTYNQSLKYKVMITTNKGDSRLIADNLSTTQNNVIDCHNASLGLRSDEYVTSVTFMFGTVKAGFAQVVQPQIYVKTLASLPNQYQFANKSDVGGKYGNEWVVSNSTWLTAIYAKPVPLPRTGY